MKFSKRFMVRAALVLTAGGVIGAFGACKDGAGPIPVPPPPVVPPPPPPPLPAPTGLTATAISQTRIDLAWTDNATTETGFKVERCSGAGCTNFAQVGANLAANTVTFADETGLTAGTPYSYRVAAFDATNTSAFATANATTLSVVASNSFTMVGAGEITTCNSTDGPTRTAALVANILNADTGAIAFTTGNNLVDEIDGKTYQECFEKKGWDAFLSRTLVALGDGDFDGGRGASGVYGYFTSTLAPIPANKGWYSYEKGNWHIVVLNTSNYQHGSQATFGVTDCDPVTPGTQECQVPSEQADWLAADLAANTKPCVAVISWVRRFYTSSEAPHMGRTFDMVRLGGIMQQHGVDMLISGQDPLYARFAQVNNRTGAPDPSGYRQFIVGTGGRRMTDGIAAGPSIREAQVGSNPNWGVLKFTLADNSYSWEYINSTTGGPTDAGGPVACH
jgi:acid phosphatase type 7